MSVVVQLSKFEGPLALLLYLIRKDEMDIFDIKINEITTQYLDYIKLMKELDLEVAGEFVAMAATLIQIKSKMLLPQYDEKGEIIEVEDPRKELVQKLLEYQKYQEAARLLYERPLVGRDMWTRGVRLNIDEPAEEIEVEENGLFTMIALYRQIMRSAKKRIHQVTAKAQSIASRILEIKDMLTIGTRRTLNELVVGGENRMRQVLITFLSVLELAKLGFVGLYQSETYGDLWIDLKKPIENDVVSRVEEYESIDSKADSLFAEADADAQTVLPGNENAEEFVLVDAEDRLENEDESIVNPEDMASDDDILRAELELEGQGADVIVSEAMAEDVKADTVGAQLAFEDMWNDNTSQLENDEIGANKGAWEQSSSLLDNLIGNEALGGVSVDDETILVGSSVNNESAMAVEFIEKVHLEESVEVKNEVLVVDEWVNAGENEVTVVLPVEDDNKFNGEPEPEVQT